jgi:hypothetical protein
MEGTEMPRIVPQPDDIGVLPRMVPERKAAAMLSLGRHKWLQVRDQIECVQIGHRKFFSERALADFLRRHTLKPIDGDQPRPRKRVPPKRAPARKRGDERERRAAP